MLQWSQYNTLFHQNNSDYFVYNAFSNSLIELDEKRFFQLQQIKEMGINDYSHLKPDFYKILLEHKIISTKESEKKEILNRQFIRNKLCFDNSRLELSICPTLECNFRCTYCYESTQHIKTEMNSMVIDQIICFIKSFNNIDHLSITWYGGEPLLAFNIIERMTEKIVDLGIKLEEVGLITNGFLLGSEIITKLDKLNIQKIQITIDGSEQTHNKRRIHIDGSPTFSKIIENISLLMDSDYQGTCDIRINLDKDNISEFFNIRKILYDRFKGESFSVYPGLIEPSSNNKIDKNCILCSHEWKDFSLQQYNKLDVNSFEGIYPVSNLYNICSANSINSFVVGPEGELYKCWEDVGIKEMEIGNIFSWNPDSTCELISLYSVGTDPFSDSDCIDCKCLPICGGGCVNRRLRANFFNEKDTEYCSLYKNNLITFLSAFYDKFRSKELCDKLLGSHSQVNKHTGYRIIVSGINRDMSKNHFKETVVS